MRIAVAHRPTEAQRAAVRDLLTAAVATKAARIPATDARAFVRATLATFDAALDGGDVDERTARMIAAAITLAGVPAEVLS